MSRLQSGALAALILALILPSSGRGQEEGIAVGSKAPPFTAPDLEGKPVNVGDYIGKKPILLEYWATWCSSCRELLPKMKAAHEKFGGAVEFFGVNVTIQESREAARAYVKKHGIPFRILYDEEGASTRAYGASVTSFVVIVDRDGKVAYTGVGGDQPLERALARVAAPKASPTRPSSAGVPDTTAPEVGSEAPPFTLPWAGKSAIGAKDDPFDLGKKKGKTVVLAFYPKDFTGGCEAEMKAFTERYDELFGEGVVVVGISADSLTTHKRWAESLGLPFKLLSDPDQKVARLYGSAGPRGFNRRTVFVIDSKGRVAYREMRFGALDPKAYESLREAVKKAKGGDAAPASKGDGGSSGSR